MLLLHIDEPDLPRGRPWTCPTSQVRRTLSRPGREIVFPGTETRIVDGITPGTRTTPSAPPRSSCGSVPQSFPSVAVNQAMFAWADRRLV